MNLYGKFPSKNVKIRTSLSKRVRRKQKVLEIMVAASLHFGFLLYVPRIAPGKLIYWEMYQISHSNRLVWDLNISLVAGISWIYFSCLSLNGCGLPDAEGKK